MLEALAYPPVTALEDDRVQSSLLHRGSIHGYLPH
jgi:hypothetical protein